MEEEGAKNSRKDVIRPRSHDGGDEQAISLDGMMEREKDHFPQMYLQMTPESGRGTGRARANTGVIPALMPSLESQENFQ